MDIPKGMKVVKVKNNISGQFEDVLVPLSADLICGDPSLQQAKDDEELLKKEGDSYTRVQKGAIHSPQGLKIECDLTFIRSRNKQGGVDVTCIVPCLAALPGTVMGKP